MTNLLRGPAGFTMSSQEFWRSAVDEPLGAFETFTEAGKDMFNEAPGLGPILKEMRTPPAAEVLVGRGVTRPMTGEEAAERGIKLLSEDDYKASPHFRKAIPWDGGMTEPRARALAEEYDVSQVRQHYASKRPLTAFLGGLAGGAVNPINYIPVVGSFGFAASAGRVGYMAARVGYGAADAALNVGVASLLQRDLKAKFGDDVSYERILQDMAMAALAGGILGAAGGAWNKLKHPERVEAIYSQDRARKAAVVLNNAIESMVLDGEVRLGPTSRGFVHEAARTARRFDQTAGAATATQVPGVRASFQGEASVSPGLGPDVPGRESGRLMGEGGELRPTETVPVSTNGPPKADMSATEKEIFSAFEAVSKTEAKLADAEARLEATQEAGAPVKTITEEITALKSKLEAERTTLAAAREKAPVQQEASFQDLPPDVKPEVAKLVHEGKSNFEVSKATGVPIREVMKQREALSKAKWEPKFTTPPKEVPSATEAAEFDAAAATVQARVKADPVKAFEDDAKAQGVEPETGALTDEDEIRALVQALDEDTRAELETLLKVEKENLERVEADNAVIDAVHACTVAGMR